MVKSTSSWDFDSLLTSSSVIDGILQPFTSDPSMYLEPSSLVVFCEVQPALTLHWLPRCRPCGTTWVDRFSCCPRPFRGTRNLLQFPTLFFSEIRCGVFGESYLLVTFFGTLVKPPPPQKTRKNLRSESDKACFDEVSPPQKKLESCSYCSPPTKKCASQKCAGLTSQTKTSQAFLVSTHQFFCLVFVGVRHDSAWHAASPPISISISMKGALAIWPPKIRGFIFKRCISSSTSSTWRWFPTVPCMVLVFFFSKLSFPNCSMYVRFMYTCTINLSRMWININIP